MPAPAVPGNAGLPRMAAPNPRRQRGDIQHSHVLQTPRSRSSIAFSRDSSTGWAESILGGRCPSCHASRSLWMRINPCSKGRRWVTSPAQRPCPGMSRRDLWRCGLGGCWAGLGTHPGCREGAGKGKAGLWKEEMRTGRTGGRGKEPAATPPAKEPRRAGIKN